MGLIAQAVERELGSERMEKRTGVIQVSGYTRADGTRVSAYSRRNVLSAISRLRPGGTMRLPDGREVKMTRDGDLVVRTEPGKRGRRVANIGPGAKGVAADAVLTASAKDNQNPRSFGGSVGHPTTRAAARHERASLTHEGGPRGGMERPSRGRPSREGRPAPRIARGAAAQRRAASRRRERERRPATGTVDTPPRLPHRIGSGRYRGESRPPKVSDIKKLTPEAQATFLQQVADRAQSAVWGDNHQFRMWDSYKRKLRRAGFDVPRPSQGNNPPPGFQD